ncbi:GNAT family N-acetyltransferase [Dickeya fangzhongdai]|uniref:GNAT family N-acetyltransferase n=1 Tax=Dickeya fangzhongdai TaxID=1778540 RepID=UPI001ADD4C02|nr:GNAT family N-acetyltransferase [Dickeya fangzhongdai]MBO8132349.1 GNAT family N-acetyltransferase [Dickeya fangzhongdai]
MNDSSNNNSFKVLAFSPDLKLQGLKDFDCGDANLNGYLRKKLKREFERDNINALLLLNESDEVVGFVTARPYHLGREDVPSGVFPYSLAPSVTVMQIPMLAIDKKYQKQGWGLELMRAALDYSLESAALVKGIKGVYLDALESAKPFYESFDFQAMSEEISPNGTIRMLISMDALRAASLGWQDAS